MSANEVEEEESKNILASVLIDFTKLSLNIFHSINTSQTESERRKKWADQALVKQSGCLNTLDPTQILIQEKWFEILTSQITYHKYLDCLAGLIKRKTIELKMPDLNGLIFNRHLFELADISKSLCESMQNRFAQNIIINSYFDILSRFLIGDDDKLEILYVSYVEEQLYQRERLDNFLKSNKKLNEPIFKLLNDSSLNGKDVCTDVLTSPIRRLSSLKLMVDNLVCLLSDQNAVLEGKWLAYKLETVLEKADRRVEALVLQDLLKYNDSLNSAAQMRDSHLIYHSDLELVHNNRMDSLFANVFLKNSSSTTRDFHLILYNDYLLICSKQEVNGKLHYKLVEKLERTKVRANLFESKEASNCYLVIEYENGLKYSKHCFLGEKYEEKKTFEFK